jgi:hypothetical protein
MPEIATTTEQEPAFLLRATAARLAGTTERTINRLVARGLVGTRQLPGTYTRFNLADIQRALAAHTRPAIAPADASAAE